MELFSHVSGGTTKGVVASFAETGCHDIHKRKEDGGEKYLAAGGMGIAGTSSTATDRMVPKGTTCQIFSELIA